MYNRDLGYRMPLSPPQCVIEVFRSEFDAALDYGAMDLGLAPGIVAFDINAVSLPHDVGGMTAFLAAGCLHQFLILLCKQLRLTQP